MKTQNVMTSFPLGGYAGRRPRFEKRSELWVFKMRARPRTRSSKESPASQLLAEALAALVLLVAMLLVLLAPE
jgi:hypothetical protein